MNNPSSLDIKIDKTKAGEMVKNIADEKKFSLEMTNATIIIVNPNYRWTGNFIKIPPAETKLAWVIPFTKPEGKGEIWVDTLTGGILGGIETK